MEPLDKIIIIFVTRIVLIVIGTMDFSLSLRDGRTIHYDHPVVMGIINLTPDSFFAGSRCLSDVDAMGEEQAQALRQRVRQMVADGAEMIDVGACSTRPNYVPPTAQEEIRRLCWGLPIVREEVQLPVSVDTYRAEVARVAVEELGADIVNDVYGGTRDAEMLTVVRQLGAPFILGADSADVETFFDRQLPQLEGVQVILDPDFGFSKDLQQNYATLRTLSQLIGRFSSMPMLVGVSRKRMVWQLLGIKADEALNGTTVLHTLALQSGAHILRVHDVREAVQAVRIVQALNQ